MTDAALLQRRAGIDARRWDKIAAKVVADDGAVVRVRHGDAYNGWPARLVELQRREVITRAMAEAGSQLHGDWSRAGLDPSASRPDTGGSRSSRAMPGCGPRYAQYTAAIRSVGKDCAGVVYAVCIEDIGIEEWRKTNRNVSQRNAPKLLRVGLQRLIGHYSGNT